jgi:fumarylacetoacetate (FAA) hydrolase
MPETLWHPAPRTPKLAHGDVVRIEKRDKAGRSVVGAIEQRVEPDRASP